MNAKAAKGERRQIRRAIGDDALAMMIAVQERMQAMQARIDAQGIALADAQKHLAALSRGMDVNYRIFRDYRNQPVFGRLRWLLGGK